MKMTVIVTKRYYDRRTIPYLIKLLISEDILTNQKNLKERVEI